MTIGDIPLEISLIQYHDEDPGSYQHLLDQGDLNDLRNLASPRAFRELGWRRAMLRKTLAERTGQAPDRLVITRGEHGKPRLEGADISFNASYSTGVLALVMYPGDAGEVGVDIEFLDRRGGDNRIRRLGEVVVQFFGQDEQQALGETGPPGCDAWLEEFFRLWTRKEALVKAWGESIGSHGLFTTLSNPVRWQGRTWWAGNTLVTRGPDRWWLGVAGSGPITMDTRNYRLG